MDKTDALSQAMAQDNYRAKYIVEDEAGKEVIPPTNSFEAKHCAVALNSISNNPRRKYWTKPVDNRS